jgi:hypothetical protein
VDELKIARILRLIAADNNTECKRAKKKCLLLYISDHQTKGPGLLFNMEGETIINEMIS